MIFKGMLRKKGVYFFMFGAALVLGCLPVNAFAMPVDSVSGGAGLSAAHRSDLETITKFLEEEAVVERLAKLGLSASEIESRLDTMDEYQVHKLAGKIDSVQKAGSGTGLVIGLLICLLIFIGFLYVTDRSVKIEKNS